MTQFYSDPTRESLKWSLPDCEVFYLQDKEISDEYEAGWYYWYCFPGCIPDSDPIGPYQSELDAINSARENEQA